MCLKQSLKDGTANGVIKGLSKSEHYEEAIKSMKARYHRPRLIHQTHVRMILEAARKVRAKNCVNFMNTSEHSKPWATNHLHGPFIMSVLELKLDTSYMYHDV